MKMSFLSAVLLASILALGNPVNAQHQQNLSHQQHIPYQQALHNPTVLLNNQKGILPLKDLSKQKIALLVPREGAFKEFIEQASRYAEVSTFTYANFEEHTKYYNQLIVLAEEGDISGRVSVNLGDNLMAQIQLAQTNRKSVVLALFAEGEQLANLGGLQVPILWNAKKGALEQRYAAMTLFGGLGATAKLAKTFSNNFQKGAGAQTEQIRLQYLADEKTSINISKLGKKIDAIAAEAIREQATPGAVVMVVKDGQVIFEKAYGTHTYAQKTQNSIHDIYDLASISKIMGTTPVVMRLTEDRVIALDSTMGNYLWQARTTNKKDIKLRTVLLHEAGFTPFIPFYKNLKTGDVQRHYAADHAVQLADSSFMRTNYYQEVMWPMMLQSPVKPIGEYVYSDISMYVMKEVAEQVTSKPMEEYVQEILYKPLGMKTAGYNPRQRFDRTQIVPTEQDTSFRKVLLAGYVHDQGAAMAGGVAGHAGLFSSANDLAIFGQLLLNRGEYGGMRIFKPETVDLFTSNQSKNSRRGLGFDRFDPNPKNEYPSKLANPSVYGHTGYTGTCIWIDPANQLIYIFLSNRVHPQVSTKLLNLNIRSRIQDAIYEELKVMPQAAAQQDYKKIHDNLVVVDGHNDVIIESILPGLDLSKRLSVGHTDIPRLQEGGVDVQVFAVWSDDKKFKKGAFAHANKQIDALEAMLAKNKASMALARSTKDIEAIVASGKIAAVIGVEGGNMIESRIANLETLFNRGARYLTLTWNYNLPWASAAAIESSNSKASKGLSEHGKTLIRRMNTLGMLVDLSHAGEQTFYDVLAVSTKPILVSHSNAYALTPHYRNLKDAQLKALKENGGVIGVNFYSQFLDSGYSERVHRLYKKYAGKNAKTKLGITSKYLALPAALRQQADAPLSSLIAHIDYLVKMVGVDHVAIGSDFDGIESSPQGLEDVSKFPILTKALLAHGYSVADLEKIMGQNFLRVLKENEI